MQGVNDLFEFSDGKVGGGEAVVAAEGRMHQGFGVFGLHVGVAGPVRFDFFFPAGFDELRHPANFALPVTLDVIYPAAPA